MTERYTFDGVWYVYQPLEYAAQVANPLFRTLVCRAFSKIPRDIVDHVLDKCFLVFTEEYAKGYYFPSILASGKDILAFPETLISKLDEEEGQRTVLHEVAHSWLSHPPAAGLSPQELQVQQDEAWALVDKWLGERVD